MTAFELTSGTDETKGNDWLSKLRREIDGYYAEMKGFPNEFPEDIFLKLSSWTARMSEVRGKLTRSSKQAAGRMRIDEVDPFINECDRQFKIHSRRQAVQEMDLKLVGRTT
jgi:hypothetical protein